MIASGDSAAVPPMHACERPYAPHDLLRIARLPDDASAPAWLPDAFARAPFAVVRRAPAPPGFVAVGLRGTTRAQRFGTRIAVTDIEAAFSPEALAANEPLAGRGALPAFAALALLRETRGALQAFRWGPTGSAGFELATRVATVSAASDLDLLISTPDRIDATTLLALADALGRASSRAQTRIDAQLETPSGGVALAELRAGKPRVLARASDGARLVADPWGAA